MKLPEHRTLKKWNCRKNNKSSNIITKIRADSNEKEACSVCGAPTNFFIYQGVTSFTISTITNYYINANPVILGGLFPNGNYVGMWLPVFDC